MEIATFTGIRNINQECIYDCLKCFEITSICLNVSLHKGHKFAETRHIVQLMETLELCKLSAALLISSSPLALQVCQVCALSAETAASSCDNIDPGESFLQECVNACRKCAESCRNLSH